MNDTTVMSMAQIRRALSRTNLSQLARDTGMDLRALRRIKNGQKDDIMVSTAELLSRHLDQPKKEKK